MLNQIALSQTRIAHVRGRFAFTLAEVLVSIVILAIVVSGVTYGYMEINRIAVWDSMNQAAQAAATRGMEAARAAKWNPWVTSTNTTAQPGSQDELPAQVNGQPALIQTNILDIPSKGNPGNNFNYYATNYVYVTWYPNTNAQTTPPVRQIWSACVWRFPLGQTRLFTNIVVTLRGPDQ